MNVESHVFDNPPLNENAYPLKITAKRYTFSASGLSSQGLTLLFAHCVGAHKEQWEPVIERLFKLHVAKDAAHRIREAWAFDWQNHGDAAIINREALRDRPEGVSAFEWSRAIATFVQSPLMQGHRMVALGHSAGAAAMVLTTKYLTPKLSPYEAMILVESTMVTREVFNSEIEERMSTMDFVVAATASRRDTWRSREEAAAYFSQRIPWGMWDARVVRLLVEHGLERNPLGDGVRLKCDPRQESVSYSDVEPHFEGALHLSQVCHLLPVHLIWGTSNDLVPDFIQDSLADASQGRTVASVKKVKGAGHMVVQEQPDLLTQAISDILDEINPSTNPKL